MVDGLNPLRLIDTHAHLDAAEFDSDRDALIRQARHDGVQAIVLLGVDPANQQRVRDLAHVHPNLVYALGFHPMYLEQVDEAALAKLRAQVESAMDDARFVAIGEIGLDHFVPGLDRERQREVLDAQLRIARDFDLPVLLHVRKAQDFVLHALRRITPPAGIAHAFNGSTQQAGQFIELGCALGFGGAMTFERARRIRRLAAQTPAHAIVLETDAPDIAPEWRRGKRNTPLELPRIAGVLAELRGVAPGEIAALTTANALRVMPRLGRAMSLA